MSSWLRVKKTNKRTPTKVPPEGLAEGRSYLLQVSSGAHISIFEGVEEDLFTFSILRYQDDGTLRWLEARYLSGDFFAFPAFDDDYNPLVDFWYALGASVGQFLPNQWFIMFEEASRKERENSDGGGNDEEELQSEGEQLSQYANRKNAEKPTTPTCKKENTHHPVAHVLFSGKRAQRATAA
ncbi:hypothetical protein BDA99DRAFT_576611 [Phascolomyces articulosus]|uniref:Uncharacterized protein n=1 Tax=Phascolomyces articulosus TaxID=60185 RepID=A0AAD5JYE9_9FUNG|nr:hypothetical protein BDA99DRAFT_576611 [Phascolomyces articulosus]